MNNLEQPRQEASRISGDKRTGMKEEEYGVNKFTIGNAGTGLNPYVSVQVTFKQSTECAEYRREFIGTAHKAKEELSGE